MGNDRAQITVVGSYAAGLVMATERFPLAGETVEGSDFVQMHGGKGSNQAVAVSRLGARALFVCNLGCDVNGDAALELFQQEGVDASLVTRSNDLATGVGFIMVDADGENSIAVDFGANRGLCPARIQELRQAIGESRVVLTQLEIPSESAATAMQVAREEGVQSILNPAPYTSFDPAAWSSVDVVTPNRTEAHSMLGIDPVANLPVDELALQIMALGVSNVVITLGREGAYVLADGKGSAIPGIEVEVVDTTGAGDAFAAALAVALAEENDLLTATHFAVAAGALAVTCGGVIPSLPSFSEVRDLLSRRI